MTFPPYKPAIYFGLGLTVFAAFILAFGALRGAFDVRKAGTLVLAAPQKAARFPLRVQAGQRHLSDAAGEPFLLHGDTAWSLIADLTREEVDVYLADRRARGFNTLLVSLLEHKFARKAPANIYGQAPFLPAGDFRMPNEAYFAHADWVLSRARDNGFLVILTPAYTGWDGGSDGWWGEMTASGEEALRAYGRFVGARYRGLDNIIWVHGGDYTPPNKALVRAVALGIKETAPEQLHTSHLAPEAFVANFWEGETWFDVTTIYTYGPVCPKALEAYAHPLKRPAFLIESAYENEHGAGAWRVRTQAYHALLCGASGQVFGNNPIWHFRHAGIFPASGDWWDSLGSPGAQSMTHLTNLFGGLPWRQLEPDIGGQLLTGGKGQEKHLAVASRTSDGTLGLVYIPSWRTITLDFSRFASPQVEAQWFDPSNGQVSVVEGSPFGGNDKLQLKPSAKNAGGDGDWLLILKARPSGIGEPPRSTP